MNISSDIQLSSVNKTTGNLTRLSVNPLILLIVATVLILYYTVFSGVSDTQMTTNGSTTFLIVILWSVFVFLMVSNGLEFFFNTNIRTLLKNLFTEEPELDIIVDKEDQDSGLLPGGTSVPEIMFEKQVFHIPDNRYNYEDAKAVCKAYGGRLATWKELKDAYDNGADWCGYGWSDGQMALFPTQYDKWVNLQKIEGHENDCGRPGINGGFIDNPNVKFGINCYGYKPEITQEEAEEMENAPLYPKTKKEIEFDKRVDYWKTKLNQIMVAPFNKNSWTMI